MANADEFTTQHNSHGLNHSVLYGKGVCLTKRPHLSVAKIQFDSFIDCLVMPSHRDRFHGSFGRLPD